MTLRDAKIGDTVTVKKLTGEGAVKRRIMDMGLTKGTSVTIRKVAPLGDPIEVQFFDASNQTLPSGMTQWDGYNLISDIQLQTVDAVFTEYKITDKGYTELKIGEGDGRNVADIYLGVNAYYKNSNLIGTLILWDQDDWFTLYHYMLYSREQLVIRCRRSSLQPALPYYAKCAQVSFAGKVWRLISTSRDPWNDIITVQLQRSLEPTEEE